MKQKAAIEAADQFPYEDVFSNVDGEAESEAPPLTWPRILMKVCEILNWIAQGNRDREKTIRLQVVRALVSGKSQADVAVEIGVTRAAVSRLANEFFADFSLSDRERLIAHMRTLSTAEKFSEQCTQRHQIRKQLLQSSSTCHPTPALAPACS